METDDNRSVMFGQFPLQFQDVCLGILTIIKNDADTQTLTDEISRLFRLNDIKAIFDLLCKCPLLQLSTAGQDASNNAQGIDDVDIVGPESSNDQVASDAEEEVTDTVNKIIPFEIAVE